MLRRISIAVNAKSEKISQNIVITYFFLKNVKPQTLAISPNDTALDSNE